MHAVTWRLIVIVLGVGGAATIGVAAVLGLGVLIGSFLGSKRTHRD